MNLISYAESLAVLRRATSQMRGTPESVSVRDALRLVLCAPVYARRSNPAEPLAAMDGIALDAKGVEALPARLTPQQWLRINTGDSVPPQFNAVVRIEDVHWENENPVLEKAVVYFQNIRRPAEDFEAHQLLFAEGYLLEAPDLSLLLAAGISEVQAYRRPVVTFLPSGSELVKDPAAAASGQVPESNSAMIAGLVAEWGGVLRIEEPVGDDPAALSAAIKKVLSHTDILILSAGTSMGTRDFTSDVLQTLGRMLFHGVAIHPARPVLLAQIGDVPVLGLPGYPSAAYLAATLYLKHLVCALSGNRPSNRQEVYISAEEIPARKEDSFYRVECFDVDGRVYVRKIQGGASSVRALSLMDGWMHVPPNTAIHKRDAVRVDLLKDRTRGVIAIRGVSHPFALRLFDLFRERGNSGRILFWEAQPEDALESIIERNCHLALLRTHSGRDLFPPFAHRLQEPMLRYRLFTRTVALLLRPGLSNLPEDPVIAVPESLLLLWQVFSEEHPVKSNPAQITTVAAAEDQAAHLLRSGSWDAVFGDIRFLREGSRSVGRVAESYDLIVSEGHLVGDAGIKTLIDLALSPEYEAWLGRQGAFDPASRGLL